MTALLLPERRKGVLNWPACGKCRPHKVVDAYGIDEETDHYLDIFVRCDGVSRRVTGEEVTCHPPMRSGLRVIKGAGYSLNQLRQTLRVMVFFADSGPAGERRREITVGVEGTRR
jgi:hypothetical protein